MTPVYSTLKRILIGHPLNSREIEEQRVPKRTAIAIFGTDAIASTAFASQEILVVLVPVAGMAALDDLLPISLVVVALLAIVVASYYQTLYAYPSGGGAYIVARENLGITPSLVAAASLMVDYTLTVSVSIAAGVDAIVSGIPELRNEHVLVGVGIIVFLALANLRGLRESGRLFAPPTFTYVAIMTTLVVVGLVRYASGDLSRIPVDHQALAHFTGKNAVLTGASVYLLMRAFSSGAVALSGIEAISNGIQAFRKPESRNAAIALVTIATILGGLFVGIALLARDLRPTLSPNETILSIMGHQVFGGGVLYVILQASTAGILALSANTAFAGFPRLAGQVALDRFLPRQLANLGDRLVLSNGVIVLALAAGGLFVAFGGNTSSLVPLFAVGLFMTFTLSQAGMVVHHWRLRRRRWRAGISINAMGAGATAIVTAVIVISKFTEGAWIPSIVIVLLVMLFARIHRHYERVEREIHAEPGETEPEIVHTVVVLVPSTVHKGVTKALAYAESLHPHYVHALHVSFDADDKRRLRASWKDYGFDVKLDVVDSPYRMLTRPVLEYVDKLDRKWRHDVVTVVIPEFVVHHWWEQLLHNQSALLLKARLLFREGTVVTSVPWHVD